MFWKLQKKIQEILKKLNKWLPKIGFKAELGRGLCFGGLKYRKYEIWWNYGLWTLGDKKLEKYRD